MTTTPAKPHTFGGVRVERTRLNPETRRTEPIEPQAVLRIFRPSGTSIQVTLSRADLAKLVHHAGLAAAEIITGEVPSRW